MKLKFFVRGLVVVLAFLMISTVPVQSVDAESSGSNITVTPPENVFTMYPSRSTSSKVNITLAWFAPSNLGGTVVAGYNIYRDGQLIGTASAVKNPAMPYFTYLDYANTGTPYSYAIRSYDAIGNLSLSTQTYTVTVPNPTVPYVNISAVVSGNQVTLTWNLTSGLATGYRLYRDGGVIPSNMPNATVTGPSYTETLPVGTYSYFVSAFVGSIANVTATSPYVSVTVGSSQSGQGVMVQRNTVVNSIPANGTVSPGQVSKVIFRYVPVVSTPIAPPATAQLTTSPISLSAGQSSTLAWSSTGATSCTTSGGWTGVKTTSGTQIVSPTTNTSYSITCSGTGGTSAPASVTIAVTAVNPPPPVTTSIPGSSTVPNITSVSPSSGHYGDSITITGTGFNPNRDPANPNIGNILSWTDSRNGSWVIYGVRSNGTTITTNVPGDAGSFSSGNAYITVKTCIAVDKCPAAESNKFPFTILGANVSQSESIPANNQSFMATVLQAIKKLFGII